MHYCISANIADISHGNVLYCGMVWHMWTSSLPRTLNCCYIQHTFTVL